MRNTIRQFITEQWDDKVAYTSSDISEVLGCNIRLARYYLMTMVREGYIHQLKYRGKTYYVKSYQIDMFKQFKNIGLRII